MKLQKGSAKKMQTTAEYYCAFCGEPSTTFIDISGGMEQSYIEDCQVCCRQNVLYQDLRNWHRVMSTIALTPAVLVECDRLGDDRRTQAFGNRLCNQIYCRSNMEKH
jgi:Cysteine-rich CPXCG